jgi:hypothetical protein
MLTKLLSVLLASSLALSVSVARTEAITEVLVTSGQAGAHAGLGSVALHGQNFDLSAFGWVADFTPMDMCDPFCFFGSHMINLVDTMGPIPGTLTWQGVNYQGITVDGAASGFFITLPSEPGIWHVDIPSRLALYLSELDLIASGVGIWPLSIQCWDSDYCGVSGSLTVDVKRQVLACDGFAAPADVAISVPSKSNRVIPLQMTLRDWFGNTSITDANFPSGPPPVAQISFSPAPGAPAIDVTDEVLLVANNDNAFRYDSTTNEWRLNLSTKPYTAAGRYIVRVRPGSSEYAIVRNDFDPTCEAQFVRE